MIETLKNFLDRANGIRLEVISLANSALRVGQFLLDLVRSGIYPYDQTAAYVAGQWVIYNDVLTKVAENAAANQTPLTHPAKYSIKLVLNPTQVTLSNKLPISASAVRALIDQVVLSGDGVGNASETSTGVVRQATDSEFNQATNNSTYVTPRQVGLLSTALSNALANFAGSMLLSIVNAATAEQRSAALLLLLNAADEDAQARFCEMNSACGVVTPPTAPPDTWGEPVHYEAMASGSTDPIYATVETGDFVSDDTPVPVVAHPQADVTITAAGDQTIPLADNEFTVVGPTKTLILKGYNPDTNNVYNLPDGITFDPNTRVITVSGTFANQAITLRVICQDILTQVNWDDFVVIVARTVASNTVAYVQARLVLNYYGSGVSNDLLEVQMMDGYADQPMYYDVRLSSASAPTSFGMLFERGVSGPGHIRSFPLAPGNLKSKTFKIYISTSTTGAANIGVYTFTTGTSNIGFTTL